ncbi:hypothetical protein [Maricaulis maris]|uniref:hypothetical protein n=1 Tax=Maricaulis maris TaxID=74318 RepID=UPI003A8E826D
MIEVLIAIASIASQSSEPEAFISGEAGYAVSAAVEGLGWGPVSSEYLPGDIAFSIRVVGGRLESSAEVSSRFKVSTAYPVFVEGTLYDDVAVIETCNRVDSDYVVFPQASFCRHEPIFRDAVLSLIALGYERIEFVGESRLWNVDLNEAEISRDSILTFAEAAAALTARYEAN